MVASAFDEHPNILKPFRFPSLSGDKRHSSWWIRRFQSRRIFQTSACHFYPCRIGCQPLVFFSCSTLAVVGRLVVALVVALGVAGILEVAELQGVGILEVAELLGVVDTCHLSKGLLLHPFLSLQDSFLQIQNHHQSHPCLA